MTDLPAGYMVTTDRGRLDIDVIHRFLSSESYWAAGIRRDVVARCVAGSFCVGILKDGETVAFARVVTDYATYGHLMDVFVSREHRGRGLSKAMIDAIVTHPTLQGFRRWTLGTADAHGLYEQFGFSRLAHPEQWMERRVSPVGT